MMKQERIVQQRGRLLDRLPEAREILRGSLLQRTIRHRTGCPKCARGEGHPVAVLAVGYPGGVITKRGGVDRRSGALGSPATARRFRPDPPVPGTRAGSS